MLAAPSQMLGVDLAIHYTRLRFMTYKLEFLEPFLTLCPEMFHSSDPYQKNMIIVLQIDNVQNAVQTLGKDYFIIASNILKEYSNRWRYREEDFELLKKTQFDICNRRINQKKIKEEKFLDQIVVIVRYRNPQNGHYDSVQIFPIYWDLYVPTNESEDNSHKYDEICLPDVSTKSDIETFFKSVVFKRDLKVIVVYNTLSNNLEMLLEFLKIPSVQTMDDAKRSLDWIVFCQKLTTEKLLFESEEFYQIGRPLDLNENDSEAQSKDEFFPIEYKLYCFEQL